MTEKLRSSEFSIYVTLKPGRIALSGVYTIEESVHPLNFPQLGMLRRRLGVHYVLPNCLDRYVAVKEESHEGADSVCVEWEKACRSLGANFPVNLHEEVLDGVVVRWPHQPN